MFHLGESRGTEDDARRDKHERRCENRPFQPARNETEHEHHGSQHHEVNHCVLRRFGTTLSRTRETCS